MDKPGKIGPKKAYTPPHLTVYGTASDLKRNLGRHGSMDKPGKVGSKKAYSPPRLIVYGTIRDLTRNLGRHGSKDGGTAPTIRTSLA